MVTTLIVLHIVLMVYHISVLWLDFYPFNKISNFSVTERVLESFIHGGIYAFGIYSLVYERGDFLNGSLLVYFSLLGVGVMVWWMPFLAGPGKRWRQQYQQMFHDQIKVLKTSRAVPPTLEIALQHIQLLLIIVLLVVWKLNR